MFLVSCVIFYADGCVYVWIDMYFSMCKLPFQAVGKANHGFMNPLLIKEGDGWFFFFFPSSFLEQKHGLK